MKRSNRDLATFDALPLEAQGIEVHDMIVGGIPARDAANLVAAFQIIGSGRVCRYLGISPRRLSSSSITADKPLSPDAFERLLRLADVACSLHETLGSFDEAQRWLIAPAIGLNQRVPIDLLRTCAGAAVVQTLAGRMAYGVYS